MSYPDKNSRIEAFIELTKVCIRWIESEEDRAQLYEDAEILLSNIFEIGVLGEED